MLTRELPQYPGMIAGVSTFPRCRRNHVHAGKSDRFIHLIWTQTLIQRTGSPELPNLATHRR